MKVQKQGGSMFSVKSKREALLRLIGEIYYQLAVYAQKNGVKWVPNPNASDLGPVYLGIVKDDVSKT